MARGKYLSLEEARKMKKYAARHNTSMPEAYGRPREKSTGPRSLGQGIREG